MRPWLYDTLALDPVLTSLMSADEDAMRKRVFPRESKETINIKKPYIVFGLGNSTAENLGEDMDHTAERQFFQIWVHDEGGDYDLIDQIIERIKKLLINASWPPARVTNVRYLETSQEFGNETYNTIFRYVRFQAIISEGKAA